MAEVTITDEERRKNLFTHPDTSNKHQKGTLVISEADVVNNPMLQLSEKNFR